MMALERMSCCGEMTHVYGDAGKLKHATDCIHYKPEDIKPRYGEVGFEQYVLIVDYPFSWNNGYSLFFSSLEELEKEVEKYKERSGPRMSKSFISLKTGIVTVAH
jgi:hypothetical protein